ncbi:MAG TPA: ABC transporter permease, partial [Mycobacteriales bacterium]|nr:ABC transporter permease [Mycobacteriales bacterium]
LAVSSIVSGLLLVNRDPVVGLSGTLLSGGTALRAVVLSWLSTLLPALALCAIALLVSALARNSWVGVGVPVVIALLLQLVALLSAIDPVRPALPTTGFEAWHGLARTDRYTGPLTDSAIASVGWIAVAVGVTTWLVRRRDVAPR